MATEAVLADLHKKSGHNRSLLEKSKICACFYCYNEFLFAQIVQWIDDNETAMCPRCGIDSVLGFDSRAADQKLLHEMHDRSFKGSTQITPDEWKTAVESDVWPPAPVRRSKRK